LLHENNELRNREMNINWNIKVDIRSKKVDIDDKKVDIYFW